MYSLEVINLSLSIPIFQSNRLFDQSNNFSDNLLGSKKEISKKKINSKIIDNLSFSLKEGDVLGILGHNGSGKTTLLRLLCGIYHPTAGEVKIKGSISPYLSLGTSMNSDLSGYDNIKLFWLLAKQSISLIKLTREIEENTDLGEFLHLPIKLYSAGMQARFLFAASTFIKSDILISDEQLSAGDYFFQNKAKLLLKKYYENNKIKVFASHNIKFIEENCNKVLVLKSGQGKIFDNCLEGIKFYTSINYSKL